MIREIFTYISESPKLASAKKLGHLAESISLLAREKRCQKAWLPHRTQCKSFITEHLSEAKHCDSVLVLGSGPLHEIPIETLARTFKKVTLVDIVHLKSVKRELAHFTNIEFVEHDISEIESALIKGELSRKIPEAFLTQDWGLVLSVNIMSQLPLHLEAYIEKTFKNKFQKEDVETYLQDVTRHHFLYLKSFNAPVLLITDTITSYYNKQDSVIQTDHNYAHLNLPRPVTEWNWNVAPIPEFQKDVGIKMNVGAFVLKNLPS
nr:class I SAM-dependent methyltransferase [Bacteriovorax sp. HI3]